MYGMRPMRTLGGRGVRLEGPDHVVERVAFDRDAAGATDQLEHVVEGEALWRVGAGLVIDLFADHRALEIVHPEVERDLRDELRDHDPVRFDVREVVEEQPRDGEVAQVIMAARRRARAANVTPSSLWSGW